MPVSSMRSRRCGALVGEDGSVRWRVWAPKARRVDLVLIDDRERRVLPMEPEPRGYYSLQKPGHVAGQRYAFRLDGGPERPDPCSLWQQEGVHGPSTLVDPQSFRWTDAGWRGVPRAELVFYELHVGTFTRAGTFEAMVPRLAALRSLGITALELMPVGQFPGNRNWGYDGVQIYAAQHSYGGPHGLQQLVDACHAAGLAVFLDVVYNHFGPEGNYLGQYGHYTTDHYRTPWGTAINYDGAGSDAVRDFVLDNVRMWLDEFHMDGLRLDAVHAIYDFGARHLLRAIKEVAEEVERHGGPARHIVAESDLNDPRLLWPPDHGGLGLDAQWADDFHHAVHTVFTGEKRGYYRDYGQPAQLARVLEQPFLYAGDYSPSRDRKHGATPVGLAADRFVVCLQNHDQIGNRALGDRLAASMAAPQRRLAASLLLLSPYLPLLFMGEEYGEQAPFPFFCSFGDPQLIQAVRDGRKREFAEFAWQGEVPDPHSEATFASAVLQWDWTQPEAAGLRALYGDLLTARREWPALRNIVERQARLVPDAASGPLLEMVRGAAGSGDTVQAFFNLGTLPQRLAPARGQRRLFSSEAMRYGGNRQPGAPEEIGAYECVVFGPPGWKAFGAEG